MLTNRVAIVTGASRGIGRAIALKLAEENANIALVYAGNDAAANETINELTDLGVKSKAYKCDVSDFEAVKMVCADIITEFGRIDILVNNAGVTRDDLIMRMSEQDFDAVLDTNLKGAFNFCKHASRHLMKSSCARIINISSVSGLTGLPGQANYSASKAGLIGLTKALAKELAPRGVTCNAVAPGFIETDMTKDLELALDAIPLKRTGKPREVAALVSFLASDMAAYITGEVIRIDGGMCI